jgi:hypothetical protein
LIAGADRAMGNRIRRWIHLLDMVALGMAIAAASLFVFSTALPWTAGTPGDQPTRHTPIHPAPTGDIMHQHRATHDSDRSNPA